MSFAVVTSRFTKNSFRAALCLLLLLLGLASAATPIISPGGGGSWVASGPGDSGLCPSTGSICAEWITYNGDSPYRPCCIAVENLGSSLLSACPMLDRDEE
ncbi:MAG: hypothetical protein AAF560_14295 [Acidobacteriota bacterium]